MYWSEKWLAGAQCPAHSAAQRGAEPRCGPGLRHVLEYSTKPAVVTAKSPPEAAMLRGSPARPPARSQGRWLFSCACNTLRVWDMARAIPRCVHTVTLDKGDILSLVASKDRVYAANADGSLRCGGGSRVGGRVLGSTHPPCIISGRPPACRDGRREGGSKRRAPFPGRSSAARSKCSARRGSGPALQRSSGPVASFCTAWGGAGGGQRARGRRCGEAAGGISPGSLI